MGLPNYQQFMTPILRIASDNELHTPSQFEEGSAEILGLSPEDRTQMLSSGAMTVLKDRTGWAYYALFRAGLLERPKRGTYRITGRGQEVFREHPEGIDERYLRRFAEYGSYVTPKPKDGGPSDLSLASSSETTSQTPQGQIEAAHRILQEKLSQDLLDLIQSKSPRFFENLVMKLLRKMGYGVSEENVLVIGKSGDGGVDGLINEDELGLDRIYVQAKRWKDKVGTPEIRDFVGSLAGGGTHKGIFITTSSFQPGVREYLKGVQQRVVLLDGRQLAKRCIDCGVGVTGVAKYEVSRIDTAFFDDEQTD